MVRTLIAAGLFALGVMALHLGGMRAAADDQSVPAKKDSCQVGDRERLDRMAGQMIMVGFLGDNEKDRGVATLRDQLAKGLVGGVVLYPENIRSPKQVKALIASLRDGQPHLVPLIGVDQEGGTVQRLRRRNGHRQFPSARNVGRDKRYTEPGGALNLYRAMAKELADAGFNLNFGPVLDLNLNPSNPIIGRRQRSYGTDPERVATLARAFIVAHREANVVSVAKHFPGHGSSRADSHKTLPDVSKTWREIELEPYRILIRDNMLDAVMLGHLYHPRFSDGERVPASLSIRANAALRNKHWLGFRGVVFSDDMEMAGVAHGYSIEERAIKAINAGTDVIVFSNVKGRDLELGARLHAIIVEAVCDGRISLARIEQAYGRVRSLKRRLMQKDLAGKW
jgi:beta-N-acetylhexosaminidase